MSPARRVIVNADDFGLCPAVNEAIVRAHREGVLSSASLLVNAPATAEAVALARDLPTLGLGAHLALTELAPLTACSHLAPDGRFPASHAATQWRLMVGRVPYAEIRAELAAQVECALETGLPIDHLDGHGHVHVVPIVLRAVVEICREYGIGAIRWPVAAERGGRWSDRLKAALLASWCRRGEQLATALARPAALGGLRHSGRMAKPILLATAASLPDGISEIMVHPATVDEAAYPGYLGAAELAALVDPEVAEALPPRATFADLLSARSA